MVSMDEYELLCNLASGDESPSDYDDDSTPLPPVLDLQFESIVSAWNEIQQRRPISKAFTNTRLQDLYDLAHATSTCFDSEHTRHATPTPPLRVTHVTDDDATICVLFNDYIANDANVALGLFDRLSFSRFHAFALSS